MILATLAGTFSAFALGTTTASALWPRERGWMKDWPIILPLGMGIGLGLTSFLFFLNSLVFAQPLLASALEEIGGVVILGLSLKRAPQPNVYEQTESPKGSSWDRLWVGTIFLQALLLGTVVVGRSYVDEPFGSWDAWTIWNMHARFIFRGGAHWFELLKAPALNWTQPDYPLLVPTSVARMWAFAGQDTPFIAGFVSILFGALTVLLLVGAVIRCRDLTTALIGGALLLGTPSFLIITPNQHADIPLGLYVLSTVVLLAYSDQYQNAMGLAALSGLCAGAAAWTKNEGIPFALIAAAAWFYCSWANRTNRTSLSWLLGLSAGFLPLAIFKLRLAPGSEDILKGMNHRLANLVDSTRHHTILSSFRRDLVAFGEWKIVPYLAMALPWLGTGWMRLRLREGAVLAVIILVLVGYYTVYLLTPWDLQWHLDFSLVRLLSHVWPATIFAWCLLTKISDRAAAFSPLVSISPRTRWTTFLVVNACLIIGSGYALAHQFARDELGIAYIKGGKITVVPGQGWYDREDNRKNLWIWSRGNATLELYSSAEKPASLTLQLGLRSVTPRKVRVLVRGHEDIEVEVSNKLRQIEINYLTVNPGITMIELATDEPAAKETSGNDARELSFAVYNIKIKDAF